MLHADRWAARYGFLRELWAGRSRVLADPALEAALRGAKTLPASFAALLAELLPGGGNQAWLLAHEARPGTGRGRTGPRVAEFDAFEELLAEAPWQVAIVDLARHFVDAANLSRFAARAQSRLENRLETRAFRLLTALAEGAEAGRVVVVSAPGEAAGGLDLGLFQELVTQHFPRARIYALSLTRAASVIDCGEVTSDEVEDEEADERGPVPLAFDNSLGEDAGFECLIAVVGARDVPRGVTLLELPPTGPAEPARPEPARPERARPERVRDEESEALRGQLAQARRQIELASIARQSLVEQLDAAQGRIDALEDQLAGRAPVPAKASEPDEEGPRRIDAAAAALQSARWELEQLQGELRRVTARPADELERSLAAAQARLGALHACAATVEALAQRAGADEALAGELQTVRDRLLELAGPPPTGAVESS